MTCIVCVRHGGATVIGSDRAVIIDDHAMPTSGPKSVRRGDMLLGAAGSSSQCNALLRIVTPGGTQSEEWLATAWRNACAAALPEDVESCQLVALHSGVYIIDSELSVDPAPDAYAIGSGAPYARGALAAIASGSAERRVVRALEAAAACTYTVLPPFDVLTL